MRLAWATSAALMLAVGLAEAGQGEVCYFSSVSVEQATPLGNDTVFTCPSLSEVTIPQIYQFGWRVSQLDFVSVGTDGADPPNVQATWRVLIKTL